MDAISVTIITMLIKIDTEPAKLERPASPPHFSVNTGDSTVIGKKSKMTSTCRSGR